MFVTLRVFTCTHTRMKDVHIRTVQCGSKLTLELARLLVLNPENLLDVAAVFEELLRAVVVCCPRHVSDEHLDESDGHAF